MILAKSTLLTPRCASTVSSAFPPDRPAVSVPPFRGFPFGAEVEPVEGDEEELQAASTAAPPTVAAPSPEYRRKSRRPIVRADATAPPRGSGTTARRRSSGTSVPPVRTHVQA